MSNPRVPAARRGTARPLKPLALIVLAGLMAVLGALFIAPAGQAQAATYRFWGYYELKAGKWDFAQTGPASTKPADGAVEGWRFAVADESTPRYPRATPTFAELCNGTKASAGQKRVGVVIDYGRQADADGTAKPPAPVGRCALVDSAATGAQVLAAVTSVRDGSGGLVCSIGGYPATGCGGAVSQVSAAAKAADTPVTLHLNGSSSSSSTSAATNIWTWIGVVVVLAVLAGVVTVALRRRSRV